VLMCSLYTNLPPSTQEKCNSYCDLRFIQV
jgi:hypothetical protein